MTSFVRRTRRLALLARVALGGLALAACSDDFGAGPGQPDGETQIRFVNAAQGSGPVTFRWISEDVFTGVGFAGLGGGGLYADLPAGARDISVRTTTGNTVLTFGQLTTGEDEPYTLALVRDGSGYTLGVLSDTNTTPAGKATLRLVNLGADIPNLDVYVTAPGADLETATPAEQVLTYGEFTAYLPLDPGTYQIRFTNALAKTVVLDVGNLTLATGQVRTILALDPATTGGPAQAMTLVDRNP